MNDVQEVKRLLAEETIKEFNNRVQEQVKKLDELTKSNSYGNEDFSIGLELETYVLDRDDYVTEVQGDLFGENLFSPEIGVQNIEINTEPSKLNQSGFVDQMNHLKKTFSDSANLLNQNNLELALDSFSCTYKNALDFFSDVNYLENLVFAKNMSPLPRYHAIDNAVRERRGKVGLKLPGVEKEFPTILFESLTTSLQVHLQIPEIQDFKIYYNYAIKTLAPLLSLSTNSSLMPASFYDEGLPENIFHENRIPVFEQCVDPIDADFEDKKVRFPKEIDRFSELIQEVARDESYTACLQEWRDIEKSPQRKFWEWDYKLREFWRWIRPVIGGKTIKDCCTENSLRLEYRALPTQPNLDENLSLILLTTGLIHGLVIEKHPVINLDWEKTREDFYGVVEDGLDAELHWISKEGEKTRDKELIFDEVFDFTKKGLKNLGFDEKIIKKFISPFKDRWVKKMTPSKWKIKEVRKEISKDLGFEKAIFNVNEKYLSLQNQFSHFGKWLK